MVAGVLNTSIATGEIRWLPESAVQRICRSLEHAAREWTEAWAPHAPRCVCKVESASPSGLRTDQRVAAGNAQLAAVASRQVTAAILFDDLDVAAGSMAEQVRDEASRALMLQLGAAVIASAQPSASSALMVTDHVVDLLPGDDGRLVLHLAIGDHSLLLELNGESAARHMTVVPKPALSAIHMQCFERAAKAENVSLELVVGEAELSLDALQRAEVGDVLVLPTAVGEALLLRAPSLNLSWPAYLGEHDGRRVAEVARSN